MWAILPLKDFVQAKQRLSGTLSAAERRSLFHAMVEDVLGVVCDGKCFERIILVSDDPAARLLASHFGAQCWSESDFATTGLNAVVSAAVARAVEEGATAVAVIHGDLPLVNHDELHDVMQRHREMAGDRKVTLVTDRHRQGSNVLLCTPPAIIGFGYGPGSCAYHQQQAEACGASFQVLHLPGMSRDIDNREDLLDLLSGDWPQRAGNTLSYLRDSGIATRLATLAAGGANSEALTKETDPNVSQ